MFGFAVLLTRLLHATRLAWRDRGFRGAAVSLLLLIIAATVFYSRYEGWSVVDSVYFAVGAGLTIGLGDLVPTTPLAKLFTVIYSLLSVGLFVTVGATFAKILTGPRRPRGKRDDTEA